MTTLANLKESPLGRSTNSMGERLIAAIVLVALCPLILAHILVQLLRRRAMFDIHTLRSASNAPVRGIFLPNRATLSRVLLLLNVIRGDFSLVGHRITAIDTSSSPAVGESLPGMFSLFELRRISGLDFIDEAACNQEYCEKSSVKSDLAIVIKSLLAGMLYSSKTELRDADRFEIFGVNIDNVSMDGALQHIDQDIKANAQKTIFFANAHTLNLAYNDQLFRSTLNDVDYVFPDGSGIEVACRRTGIRRKGNINGTDMLPLLCAQLAKRGQKIFMLGGEEGIAASAMAAMQRGQQNLKSAGTRNGFFDKDDCDDLIMQINNSGADILLVGMGQPLQEDWVAKNRHKLTVPVVMAVGGLFDFYAEKVSRAPIWLRELGMEWTWRLMQEPGRMWKRYIIGNPLFLLRLRNAA
ncbi:N-acetylglucosaminyldiphosphoundecaprenol N -acetyl-beta-D-mannosaminyltransferase [Zhongshania aliphaticivorans]|uniref:N-acetylglucosaminyldiphosphoundecaprenol N -acetyl-beta-D-mannosaminyltransferase n=1 Tax=Zhongshania aliphaticivorans TaxID=1470434 RepID=A0A5S9NA44_9GAMM|nr:WecB/TagA/CpsF family glycosyltransferase [Zhongshania aliphaticivorans]CAA0086974.1 N-acetylglucosaminyldiphosphoundecaprenol N -acetyl-beta-D-mannosaminyltransferase [Zhongshania aliphaticivorans]CAA0113846.1 N-acetylglucosaminyldiphosphoundecaprenol N -acetyl-beta-D-mannosaminyltransferase [Zhongshania aliphaticivorans]